MSTSALVVALLAGSVLTPLAAAQSITFEDFVGMGINEQFGTIATGGYEFVSTHAHVINDFVVPIAPPAQNDSLVYLSSEGGDLGTPITIRRANGRPFALPWFDAAELWVSAPAGYPNAASIELTISHVDGSVHTEVYPLDGIVDGAGGSPDFQTIVRPASYVLLSVSFAGLSPSSLPNYAFAIDDIAVRPVWEQIGLGTAGSTGVPSLTGMGTLASGGAGELRLLSSPSAPGLLLVSVNPSALPFKGGTLHAVPVAAALPFVTDQAGSFALAWQHAPGAPASPQLVLQAALLDPGAVGGVALSGAIAADLVGLVPGIELIETGPPLSGDPLASPSGP